jgi:hypothetical protein
MLNIETKVRYWKYSKSAHMTHFTNQPGISNRIFRPFWFFRSARRSGRNRDVQYDVDSWSCLFLLWSIFLVRGQSICKKSESQLYYLSGFCLHENFGSHREDFRDILYSKFFTKIRIINWLCLKYDYNNRHFRLNQNKFTVISCQILLG